ncbi:MAG TPA: hydantoinase B/oxoprolinase family protein [Thermotogota bacterium]|nr:hydantoinase B/oxoprolinase family protein [Thermotogota bacterium]
MSINPIQLELFKNRFISVAEEMGVTLQRTAFSPNIKERRDYSCALFSESGELIAQAAHIPVHLGSMPMSVRSAIAFVGEKGWHPGDMVMLNDPFRGGTHLPDITLVAPVFVGGQGPLFFLANRAHHADVGGMTPGSMPLSRSLYQEGIIIPPVFFVKRGELDEEIQKLLLANVRTPEERTGDFAAQLMANRTGVSRMQGLIGSFGLQKVQQAALALVDYAETLTRQAIGRIPDGTYSFCDEMEDDGFGNKELCIRVRVDIHGDGATVDFSGTAGQTTGSINAVEAITHSAVLYVFRCLVERQIPANAGCMRPVRVICPLGTLVNARFPAAVAGGNVETSQRIVDVLFGALSQALPEKIPAASQGTMNNLTIGGIDPRNGQPYAYYETLGGGCGGGPGFAGESAIHSHMTNTMNTPVEALEYAYPFRAIRYAIRAQSGGAGEFPGGDGLVRELEVLGDAQVTMLSERRVKGAYGLFGGDAGKPGENLVLQQGSWTLMPSKFHASVSSGSRVRVETPGGGGFGTKQTQEGKG